MDVLFSGRVQGVGFRYTVCRLAADYEITGFVQNLHTGDVRMVAEGDVEDLKELYNEIRASHLGRYLTGEQVSWASATREYKSFGIKY